MLFKVPLLNNISEEKNINTQQALLSSFLKKQKIINISYLIIVLIKMRLVMLLVFTQQELACKYRLILQISVYNWVQNCIFFIPDATINSQARL